MNQALIPQESSVSMKEPLAPLPKRHKRAGKRKSGFRMDTPPYPVRAIWELAKPEERQEAHKMGVLMLEHWLGRMTRKQLGEQLNLPPLRVWQMSQQALAGMVVGLMAQPKRPPRGTPMQRGEKKQEQDDLKVLRKRVAELEQETQVMRELLALMRDLPAAQEQAATPKAPKGKKMGSRSHPFNPLDRDGRSLAPESKPKEG